MEISGFRSISYCHVVLGSLNVLYGANNSGKTNFLKAILFLGNLVKSQFQAVQKAYNEALYSIFRADYNHEMRMMAELICDFPDRLLQISQFSQNPVGVLKVTLGRHFEEKIRYGACLGTRENQNTLFWFKSNYDDDHCWNYELNRTQNFVWKTDEDYTRLSRISYYQLFSDEIRRNQVEDHPFYLNSDGSNLRFLLKNLNPERKERICDAFRRIFEDIPYEEDDFEKYGNGALRGLAVLAALFQENRKIVMIESPERSLHHHGYRELAEAIHEAKDYHQIFLTTYQPEFDRDLCSQELTSLGVFKEDGETKIGKLASSEWNQYAHWENMGMDDQFVIDPEDLRRQEARRGQTS